MGCVLGGKSSLGLNDMTALDPVRVSRAVHLDATPQDDTTGRVTSADSFHLVNIGDSGPLCDCRDFAIRGGPCKHVIAVGLANGDRQVLEALRRLVPNPQLLPARRPRVTT